jgi:hypothetical protein
MHRRQRAALSAYALIEIRRVIFFSLSKYYHLLHQFYAMALFYTMSEAAATAFAQLGEPEMETALTLPFEFSKLS